MGVELLGEMRGCCERKGLEKNRVRSFGERTGLMGDIGCGSF